VPTRHPLLRFIPIQAAPTPANLRMTCNAPMPSTAMRHRDLRPPLCLANKVVNGAILVMEGSAASAGRPKSQIVHTYSVESSNHFSGRLIGGRQAKFLVRHSMLPRLSAVRVFCISYRFSDQSSSCETPGCVMEFSYSSRSVLSRGSSSNLMTTRKRGAILESLSLVVSSHTECEALYYGSELSLNCRRSADPPSPRLARPYHLQLRKSTGNIKSIWQNLHQLSLRCHSFLFV
jgi:hypothetical protein